MLNVLYQQILAHLWKLGYAPEDIIAIIFRVCKNTDMAEFQKLEFIKVRIIYIFMYSTMKVLDKLSKLLETF